MKPAHFSWLRCGVAVVWLAAAIGVQAQPVGIGMAAPLSGPGSNDGLGLRHGILLAIARANEAGGVDGRPRELLALDDRGDPSVAADDTRELLRRGAVALTGVHGAHTAAAVADVLAAAGSAAAPLVAPATRAEGLRESPLPAVFHRRAGTDDEMNAAMVHLDALGITCCAMVT